MTVIEICLLIGPGGGPGSTFSGCDAVLSLNNFIPRTNLILPATLRPVDATVR